MHNLGSYVSRVKEDNHNNNNLIIINVTHISMFKITPLILRRNVTKCGKDMESRWECNIAEPKFELKLFRLSSCVFYGRGHI